MGEAPLPLILAYWNGTVPSPARNGVEYLRWLCQENVLRWCIDLMQDRLHLSDVDVPGMS